MDVWGDVEFTEEPMAELSKLVGHVVRGVWNRPMGRDEIVFDVAGDIGVYPVVWTVEGDCCSQSEFQLVDLDKVNGKRIDRVENLASADVRLARRPVQRGDDTAECLQVYGVLLTAEDGSEGLVIHANYSNGYYGGWLNEDGQSVYGWPTREADGYGS